VDRSREQRTSNTARISRRTACPAARLRRLSAADENDE